MTGLPAGWASARVGELIAEGGITDGPFGSNLKTAHYRESGPRVIRLQNVGEGVFRDERAHIEQEHYERLAKHAVLPGDVLIASLGETLPRACQAPDIGPAIVKADVIRARTASGVSSAYLMWALNSPQIRERVANQIKGVGRPRFSLGGLRVLEMPLAPAAEQERIVAAIEEAFSLLDAGETSLHNTGTRLKRMRDSVLTAAATGQLVPQDPTDPPADKLLTDLGIDAIAACDGFPSVPDTWRWARVVDLGRVELGRQRHPDWHAGPNMKPYLRVANVFEDRVDTTDVMEMHFEPEMFERFKLHPGDVLLNEGQSPELLGRPALYKGVPPDVAFTNSLLKFRAGDAISPEWALLVFRAYMRTGRFTRESRITTNIAHLSAGRLKEIEFPVPPREEQARIVTEVERQLSFLEAAGREVDAGLVRAAGLRRSVLKAAFEGRLVEQDPTDESASVLLERIAAEQAAAAPKKRAPRRPTRGKAVAS